MPDSKPAYFPGLNALRFYAALSVVVSHIPLYSSLFGRLGIEAHPIELLFINSRDAVTLFFVLSGFLITYLLLSERERTETVAVGRFYARRALRIWPLYYATIALAYIGLPLLLGNVVYPAPAGGVVLAAVLLLTANIPYSFANHSLLMVAHLWSIGVEEQFYLAWPVLLKHWNPLRVLAGVIVVKALVWIGLSLVNSVHPLPDGVFFLLDYARFECMAIGGIGAYLVFTRSRWLFVLYRPSVQITAWLCVILTCIAPSGLWRVPVYDALIAVVFMAVIVNVATNERALVRLRQPLLERLGNYSYGMYMLHPFVIYVLALGTYVVGGSTRSLAFYGVAVGVTMGAAALSYRYFERPFLRLKRYVEAPDSLPQTMPTPPIMTTPARGWYAETPMSAPDMKSPM